MVNAVRLPGAPARESSRAGVNRAFPAADCTADGPPGAWKLALNRIDPHLHEDMFQAADCSIRYSPLLGPVGEIRGVFAKRDFLPRNRRA
jgi:hypothetical protein